MGPAGFDVGEKAAAGCEFTADKARNRFRGGHDIAQHAIDGILVKNSKIAIREKIHFESFEFETQFARFVLNEDRPVIWQACLGAHGSIFREADGDFVTWEMIWPSVERGELGVDSGARMSSGVIGHACLQKYSTSKGKLIAVRW